MEDVTLSHAKEHLEELIARAAQGEEITITDPTFGKVTLKTAGPQQSALRLGTRKLGLLEGVIAPPPDGFFAPMTAEELRDWYGEDG